MKKFTKTDRLTDKETKMQVCKKKTTCRSFISLTEVQTDTKTDGQTDRQVSGNANLYAVCNIQTSDGQASCSNLFVPSHKKVKIQLV